MIAERVGEKRLRSCVVPVTGNLDADVEAWAKAIDCVLIDREAAFQRAAELRRLLAEELSWTRAARELLQGLTLGAR